LSNILKRTTLLVRDAEKAATWYETVFGMKRWLDTPFTLSGVGLAVGEKGDRTRLIIMQCDDPIIGMIGLLQWVEPTLDAPSVPTKVSFGMPIFVIASDDVRGVCERAKLSGVNVYAEPYEWNFVAPDGLTKNMIGCSLFDLDGYFFEVNEIIGNG
jgi:catechol 2,3-dioxygenase-like lactoylglutathione lyase family enzyme